ncbi:hypothetical protein Pelo_18488 [Pelomyxa schiedti]|nr:hypothetical protein Pelo_18488 [Pelomyxa schiedti]
MNEDALCHVDAAAAIDHILMVSRVVWDHIVAPVVAPHDVAWLGTQVRPDDCVWVVAAAEALFPLVPRACRALLAATLLEERHVPNATASRYAVLRCGGMAGGCARCIEWIIRNKATRNNAKECVAVLKGLCAGVCGITEIAILKLIYLMKEDTLKLQKSLFKAEEQSPGGVVHIPQFAQPFV